MSKNKFFLTRAYRKSGRRGTKEAAIRSGHPAAYLLPHERDESLDLTRPAYPRAITIRAKRDLDAGLVDTDLRATPGLDAERRRRILRRKEP